LVRLRFVEGFEYQLIPPEGEKSFHQAQFDDLIAALEERLKVHSVSLQIGDSKADLHRLGLGDDKLARDYVLVKIDVEDDISREVGRTKVKKAVAAVGRPDIDVVNA
jgi:hypothetical protein